MKIFQYLSNWAKEFQFFAAEQLCYFDGMKEPKNGVCIFWLKIEQIKVLMFVSFSKMEQKAEFYASIWSYLKIFEKN